MKNEMVSQKEFEKISIKMAQDAFEAGRGKKISKHTKDKLAEYIKLKLNNPTNAIYRFTYCEQAKEYTTQEYSGDNAWMCLHDGELHNEKK